jgi:hypothetical protein
MDYHLTQHRYLTREGRLFAALPDSESSGEWTHWEERKRAHEDFGDELDEDEFLEICSFCRE